MYTAKAKSIDTYLFARLDSGEGTREIVEMEVPDAQGPEQGAVYIMIKNCTRVFMSSPLLIYQQQKHNTTRHAAKEGLELHSNERASLLQILCPFCCSFCS